MLSRPRYFCAALLAACFSSHAFAQGGAAPVVVATATESEITQVAQFTGTVTALRRASLSVATAGLVTGLKVDAGTHVNAGDLLLSLDDELARHQHESAAATETQARAAHADAQRRLEEARRLAPQQSIAETVVRDIEAEVAEDEAALAQASANLGYRKGILDRHQLKAPFVGVISSRSVELGEWVAPGQAVFSLVSSEELRLDFQVPEDFLGRVQAGAEVTFTLGSDRDTVHTGVVATTVPVTNPTVRTFLVRIAPAENINGILPGMSARAELRMGTGRRGITVSRDAVLRYSDGRTIVWAVSEKDGTPTASERLVQTGLSFDGRVEVLHGLGAGDRIVVEGNESLRADQALDIRGTAGN